jgi:hypothetical protein
LHAFSHAKGYVIVGDPEFAHQEERSAKEIPALCNAKTTPSPLSTARCTIIFLQIK